MHRQPCLRMGGRRLAIALLLLIGASCLVGCVGVVSVPEVDTLAKLPLLTTTQLSNDTLILEVGFVDVPKQADRWRSDVWSELDEQHLSPKLRSALATNGLRCGLSGEQLPTDLRAALDATLDDRTARLESIEGVTEQAKTHRRIQTRSGTRSEVVTAGASESMVVLLHDGEQVVGRTFREAQPIIAVRAFPMGDGSGRIELTPELRYGPSRQKWVGNQGSFQLDSGQKSEVFSRLMIETVLSPGQTLVVAATGPAKSLGGNFFGWDQEGRQEKVLLIRLAQSQYDDVFMHDQTEIAELVEPVDVVGQGVDGDINVVAPVASGVDSVGVDPAPGVEVVSEEEDESLEGLVTELDF